jgi:hypothetical protein
MAFPRAQKSYFTPFGVTPGKIPRKNPASLDLCHCGRHAALERKDQILGVQLELLQADLFKLFVFGKVGLLQQLFQTLSVAAMFGEQAIELFAQRGTILYFVHQAPPLWRLFLRLDETANIL